MKQRPREYDALSATWEQGYLAGISDSIKIIKFVLKDNKQKKTIVAALEFLLESEE